MTRQAFENSVMVASAIGASTNVPIHINAIARHVGVELSNQDWQHVGSDVPVLVNLAPAGEFLGEDFHRAGGVPAVMRALLTAGHLHGDAVTVSGLTVAENLKDVPSADPAVIRPFHDPVTANGGLLVLTGEPVRLRDHENVGHYRPFPVRWPATLRRPVGVRLPRGGLRRA
ncbi:dihydroxy-acid dehydratase [Streptomyces sp. DH7]|uniref:dihydroxy-acid dehydratase domain-containing protein n=1 Tax=Streptomyces sp. DH7 TaxID=2857006 RepID=UPI0027E21498|nr:dihydroxy-acid dehydratase [Streptomyces sp. DH7]